MDAASRHARAWLLLVGALAVHVADEALTGFLDFYNPLVLRLRERLGFWPMPAFSFDVWLAGLILVVIVLAAMTPLIRRRAAVARPASWIFGAIMFANGIAHLAGSVYFQRWLPGATSAPLLLITSAWLMRATTSRP